MSDPQQQIELVPYKITKEDGSTGNSSEGYSGKAEVEYPNRDTYVGDFLDGKKSGKGTYTFNNGDKYVGDWLENLQHGIGRTDYAKGGKYFGGYLNGQRRGEGVYTYPNGDIYSGSWVDGLKTGNGTYIVNSCKLTGNNYMKLAGYWYKGEIQDGKWIFPDKTYFEGKFENNKPKGEGVWNFKNNNVNPGEYKHSEARQQGTNDIETKLTWKSKEENFDPRIHLISSD